MWDKLKDATIQNRYQLQREEEIDWDFPWIVRNEKRKPMYINSGARKLEYPIEKDSIKDLKQEIEDKIKRDETSGVESRFPTLNDTDKKTLDERLKMAQRFLSSNVGYAFISIERKDNDLVFKKWWGKEEYRITLPYDVHKAIDLVNSLTFALAYWYQFEASTGTILFNKEERLTNYDKYAKPIWPNSIPNWYDCNELLKKLRAKGE